MKIAGAHLQMASSHISNQSHEITESLRAWVGTPPTDVNRDNARPPEADWVQISDAGRSALTKGKETIGEERDSLDNDPKLLIIRTMLEIITGRKIEVFDSRELSGGTRPVTLGDPNPAPPPSNGNPQPSVGYGVEYDRHELYSETERTTFSAQGVVHTADGREISFDLHLFMERSFSETSNLSLRLGDAVRKKDPLVLNFAGNATQLTDTRFHFDLDADGQTDEINFVMPGSGFLVLDRNHDGKVNNGSELFGPSTGDGYAELATLDEDGNGWIDEGDKAYAHLSIWTKDVAGNDRLQSLVDSEVGALALAHVNTPFELRGHINELNGLVRDSGVFLQENGKAGTIQQIDLVA